MSVLSYHRITRTIRCACLGLLAPMLLIMGISCADASQARDNPHLFIKGFDVECLSCHSRIPQSCTLFVTPVIANMLMIQIPDFPLPLSSGKITCTSCHFIDKQDAGKKSPCRLREEYAVFKKRAEHIDPHKTGVFCFLCHEREPREKGGPLYLKYDNDTVRICKDCHDNKRARADNHPVGVAPSPERRMSIPEGFPLADGKITCITCHMVKCQGEGKNPFFLRGGPYKNRFETCFVCHVREQYNRINPHDQISPEGEIMEDRCLYCHMVDTDEKGGKRFGFKFKAPFRLYCIGCHPVEVTRHPFGAHHAGRYIDSIWAGLPMSQRERISHNQSFKITPVTLSGQLMCTSCHNPHDTRPGPKLRISKVSISCLQCHYRHYGERFPMQTKKAWKEPDILDMSPRGDDHQSFGYVASLRFYCIGCHPNKEKKHPYGVDHNGLFIKRFYRDI